MKRIINTWPVSMAVLVVGIVTGISLGREPALEAQNVGSPELLKSIYAVNPAPILEDTQRSMWPNQPNASTHWSIKDIRRAHELLAAAEKAGKRIDPNSTLHDFPYWTRTHGMFIEHVPEKGPAIAAQHMGYAQFIIVMGGSGTVQAGGALQKGTMMVEAGRPIWGELRGVGIVGGETFELTDGDWVSIPANTAAQFRATRAGGLTYMVMKVNAMMYPWDLIR
jgi:quercetin dioxygenase-like cupin family protein